MATVLAPARSVARVAACALWGLETALVTVEADVANGLPSFTVVGMPDTAVSEARERVRAAIRNSGFEFPLRRVVVNLAPAERRKEGTGFDLAIALAVLRATGQLTRDADALCLGELALDGTLRPVRGVMPRARRAMEAGVMDVFVSASNVAEAAALGANAFPFGSLREVVEHVERRARVAPSPAPPPALRPRHPVDLGDIAGHETPKRALEIAAAGGHSLLLIGPPGTGKTLLARAIASILPPLDPDEAIVASAVHSVAGLVGGGSPPRPGEVSLSHTGALFLDELAEFSPHVLDTLREPLEEGAITISRAGWAATYPARFVLVAAMNPCPCGPAGEPARQCTCLPAAVERYPALLSGPIMDRIDLRVHVPRIAYEELRDEGREASRVVRERVLAARERMRARLLGSGRRCNAEMLVSEVRRHCRLAPEAETLAAEAMRGRSLSARGFHRMLRVARTIADLADNDDVRTADLALALLLRAQP